MMQTKKHSMNLHQVIVTEMTGPIPYELTLGEIIRDGDITNHYQTYVLSLLSGSFKAGIPASDIGGSLPISSEATSVAAVESIKSLSPSDKVALAQYLLDAIKLSTTGHSTQMSSSDWTRFVLQHNQD
jgi:hypothetical protein